MRCAEILIALAAASLAFAQGLPARDILDRSPEAQREFVRTNLELGLPQDHLDEITMLVLNRSTLAVPMIEAWISDALKSESSSQSVIDTASELIAYAGNEAALEAIARLVALNEQRFAPLVGRALTHSRNWRNPFTVVYRALASGSDVVARETATWVDGALGFDRLKQAWAEAIVDRYGGVPAEADWARDPIVLRLPRERSAEMRQTVTRLVSEGQRKNTGQ